MQLKKIAKLEGVIQQQQKTIPSHFNSIVNDKQSFNLNLQLVLFRMINITHLFKSLSIIYVEISQVEFEF